MLKNKKYTKQQLETWYFLFNAIETAEKETENIIQ